MREVGFIEDGEGLIGDLGFGEQVDRRRFGLESDGHGARHRPGRLGNRSQAEEPDANAQHNRPNERGSSYPGFWSLHALILPAPDPGSRRRLSSIVFCLRGQTGRLLIITRTGRAVLARMARMSPLGDSVGRDFFPGDRDHSEDSGLSFVGFVARIAPEGVLAGDSWCNSDSNKGGRPRAGRKPARPQAFPLFPPSGMVGKMSAPSSI